MQEWLMMLIESYGYISIFLLMVVENICPPIPSEVILTFGGFMTIQSDLTFLGVMIVGTCGAFIGSFLLYGIARRLNKERLYQLMENRYIKWLHFQKKDVEKTLIWFDQHNQKSVMIGRMVPVIRSLISIPAGISHMNIFSFSLYSLLGILFWNSLLVGLGCLLGQKWELVLSILSSYSFLVKVGLVILIGYVIVSKLHKKRSKVHK